MSTWETVVALTLVLAMTLLSGGCVASNLAEVVTELAKDPASVCIRVTSVYGTLTYGRSNSTSDTMCDVFKVTGNSGGVIVPISVRPVFEMQQPQMEPTPPRQFRGIPPTKP